MKSKEQIANNASNALKAIFTDAELSVRLTNAMGDLILASNENDLTSYSKETRELAAEFRAMDDNTPLQVRSRVIRELIECILRES